MKCSVILAFLAYVCTTGLAEVISTTSCDEGSPLSDVVQVRVDPCPAPGDGQSVPCKLVRGTTATLSVDFTPKQELSDLWVGLTYPKGSTELPYLGMDKHACNYLSGQSCPVQPGSTYTYSVDVKLSNAFPSNSYPIKIKLTDGSRFSNIVFCQQFYIDLN